MASYDELVRLFDRFKVRLERAVNSDTEDACFDKDRAITKRNREDARAAEADFRNKLKETLSGQQQRPEGHRGEAAREGQSPTQSRTKAPIPYEGDNWGTSTMDED